MAAGLWCVVSRHLWKNGLYFSMWSKGFCLSEWTETATLRVEVYNSHTENVLRVHGKIILEGRWSNKYVNRLHIDVTGAALAQVEKPGYAYHRET